MSIAYISTRGYYDLSTGKTLKKKNYNFSLKNFEKLEGKNEVTIMIHGLRNDRRGAKNKFLLAKNRLQKIGYKYPVIGYSYDSNTKGAHLQKYVKRSLRVGQKIAKKNGTNLGKFIMHLKRRCTKIKIRLIGHSLGSEVIFHTLLYLSKKPHTKGVIESIYFFGSSLSDRIMNEESMKLINRVLVTKLWNYYAPSDSVLNESTENGLLIRPLGLVGLKTTMPKYRQKKVMPKNHRFASYVVTMNSFP